MKTLGITCGIATVGWAVIETKPGALAITAAGVWSFDTPETPKDHTPLNALRQRYRGQRTVIRRRRQRMSAIRLLFHESGLLPDANRDVLVHPGLNPWDLRAAAFERSLTGPELAVALGHIAVHRGFKSNRKRAAGANDSETSRMKKAIAATQARLQQYRTVGLMFANDPEFRARKRNKGDFTRSVLRIDLEHEVRQIFIEQRRRHNPLASATLEESFNAIAFHQNAMGDSAHLVGTCRFEPAEKRTARRGYAYEMFRLLSRLANITISEDGKRARLDAGMIRLVADDFGATRKISYRAIRDRLKLGQDVRFVGVQAKDETQDVVARQGNAAEGTYTLRRIVGPEGWQFLMANPVLRDRIAEVLTFRNEPASIRAGLAEAGLQDPVLDAVMIGVEGGATSQFTGAGHLSAKAARRLLPALRNGVGYFEACEAAGYDHDAPGLVSLEDVRNPVARKAVTEAVKLIRAVIRQYGHPDAIHVGLMRDIGKSADERGEITRGIEAQNKRREASRLELDELLARDTKPGELLRYELWKEQGGRCLYTDTYIDAAWIAAGDNTVQVSHILPWSRFGDDSFVNKTLCLARAGQAKRDRTAWEWFEAEALDWDGFVARVEACKGMKPAKQNGFYLRKNAAEIEATFRNRHLSDTRYIARLLLLYLGQTYPEVRQVRARASQLTGKLRRAWGLSDLKHDEDGKRLADLRHRAVDAMVLASITERALEEMALAAREAERLGSPRGFDFSLVDPPAEGFRDVVREVTGGIFPARAERRRVDGETHAATIKRITDDAVFERKPVERLTLGDLENIPVPAPYRAIKDPQKLRNEMVTTLRLWIERGRPKDDPPRSAKGDLIRKVRVASGEDVRVPVRGGSADRGEIARVDVFSKPANTGKRRFYLVPVYPHQIADRGRYPQPPDRAVVPGAAESEWAKMHGDAAFLFSLFPHSLVEVAKPDGEVIRGYFKGIDRATGAIAIGLAENMQAKPVRVGSKTLREFDKLKVDRLGRITRVEREVRTWHGVACM